MSYNFSNNPLSREELEREQVRLLNEKEENNRNGGKEDSRDRDRDRRRERNDRWNRDGEKDRRFDEDPRRFDNSRLRSPQQLMTQFEESFVHSATKHTGENGLIPVLRHISILESHLGSLGSKAVGLLSEALYMEKSCQGSADVLVSREEIFLETLREKFIGLLEVGFMDQTLSGVADIVVQKISSLLSVHKSGKSSGPSNERDRDVIEIKEKISNNYSMGMKSAGNNSAIIPPPGSGPMDVAPTASSIMPSNMWGGMMGPMGYPMMGMNPMMGPGMMDPNMMMGQYGMMPPGMMAPDGTVMGPGGSMMGPGGAMMASGGPMMGPDGIMIGPGGPMLAPDPSLMPKEVMNFKTFTLYPPNPNAPPAATRERPPGCKTIFVGGLPENATEEMMREIFGRCGELLSFRLSNKKFCHIRFVHEASVDAALFFSGFRMCIGTNTDAPNTGRLHVDYANARDDQYEWECRQRQLQREQRHRDQMEKERFHVPSPPPVVHYSDHEANIVSEKIKTDEHFSKAVEVVITWLDRGSCNKRNTNIFYSMIQSTNSHVRRLLAEKVTYEEEFQRAKETMKGHMQGLLTQFDQIEQVFTSASHKKVWDHFTKPQRKNIEMWKKQATEIKTVELEGNMIGGDDEMDVSDNEDDMISKKPKKNDPHAALKDESENLRCQLEAYKNEMDLVRYEHKIELDNKDKQFTLLQQTLQGLQQQLLEAKRKQSADGFKIAELEKKLKTKKSEGKYEVDESGDVEKEKERTENEVDTTDPVTLLQTKLSEKEAKLIGLITIFLHVHPFGAGTDYVWSYLQKLEPYLKPSEIEQLMMRFPSIFQQELSGIGANMERRWVYEGFKAFSTS